MHKGLSHVWQNTQASLLQVFFEAAVVCVVRSKNQVFIATAHDWIVWYHEMHCAIRRRAATTENMVSIP
jgi:hypothetical protein